MIANRFGFTTAWGFGRVGESAFRKLLISKSANPLSKKMLTFTDHEPLARVIWCVPRGCQRLALPAFPRQANGSFNTLPHAKAICPLFLPQQVEEHPCHDLWGGVSR